MTANIKPKRKPDRIKKGLQRTLYEKRCRGMFKYTRILFLISIAATCMIGSTDAAQLVINEFAARNDSEQPLRNGELLDEDGDPSDWIEIYNPTE